MVLRTFTASTTQSHHEPMFGRFSHDGHNGSHTLLMQWSLKLRLPLKGRCPGSLTNIYVIYVRPPTICCLVRGMYYTCSAHSSLYCTLQKTSEPSDRLKPWTPGPGLPGVESLRRVVEVVELFALFGLFVCFGRGKGGNGGRVRLRLIYRLTFTDRIFTD